MAKTKNDQTLRSMLLNNGNVRQASESTQISSIRHTDKAASQAAAIAARKASFAAQKPR